MKSRFFITGIIIVLVATSITYANHFGNAFQFDDFHTIVDNIYVRDIKNIPLFFKDGTTLTTLPANQAYRPLVATSYAIDYWLGKGYNLFYFHLSTFLIFLGQCIVMVLFFRKLFESADPGNIVIHSSLFAAALFMLHPAVAETVNYISARSDVQSTFFVLLGFALYIHSEFCRKKWIYLIPVFVGGLAKPTAAMFAPLLFFYILFFEEQLGLHQLFQKQSRLSLINTLKKSFPAFFVCALMYAFITKMTPASWVPGGDSAFFYCISQPFVLVHYFSSFFVPTGLSADTDWQALNTVLDIRLLIGLLFIFLLLLVAYHCSKNKMYRPVSFGILWFFITLIPTSSIIPLGEIMNDHRMYFPFVGLAFSVTWALAMLIQILTVHFVSPGKNFKFILTLTATITLVLYAYGTHERNKIWLNGETLWKDVTLKSPDNPRGQMNYGLALMQKGDYASAIHQYEKTISAWPYYGYAYINMGIAKAAIGNTTEAELNFKKALECNPGVADGYYFYGKFLIEKNRVEEARLIIKKGLLISSGYANLLTLKNTIDNLEASNLLSRLHSLEKLKKAANDKPTADIYIDLSLAYYNNNEFQKCIEAATKALSLNPSYDIAYNNICAAYNMLKQWDKAIEAGEKGLRINPNNQLLKNNLAESKKNRSIK